MLYTAYMGLLQWNEERRFLLHCELDAVYFHLYNIVRDDVDMETFTIVSIKTRRNMVIARNE